MIRRRSSLWISTALPSLLSLTSVVLFLTFSGYGCRSHAHTSDSHLRQIDELLNAQLPQGTPRSRVQYFLNSRGYKIEDHDKTSLVAVVRHIDTDTLQPATARVTFHFDSNDKLIAYELQSAPDAPLQP
jgi:hypothetical protein